MTFSSDSGGFKFSCNDANFLVCTSKWNTRPSQISELQDSLCIMVHNLPNPECIARIIEERPTTPNTFSS
jgi:hypothetical protein